MPPCVAGHDFTWYRGISYSAYITGTAAAGSGASSSSFGLATMVVHLRFLTLAIGMYVVRGYSSHLAGSRRLAAVVDGTSEQARLGILLVSTFVDPRRGRYGNKLANGQRVGKGS